MLASILSLALLLPDALAGVPSAPASRRVQSDAPILLDGARLKQKGQNKLTHKIHFPTPGVWYVWIRATNHWPTSSVLTYDLDGVQLLRSARKDILVPPHVTSQWLSNTRHPEFRAEVHVDEPGEHVLGLTCVSGDVTIERVALTLFYSATPAGDTLNHAGDPAQRRKTDPGGGRLAFPLGQIKADGFRKDWKSPEIAATGTTYYVDSTAGDDSFDGTAPDRAWKTFKRMNDMSFMPGDAILLKRGSRWEQGLSPRGSGNEQQWITIGAYGEGPRPHVHGLNKPGLSLIDQSYWVIQDLEFSNAPEFGQSGIEILATAQVPQPKGIKLFNCVVYDTGRNGIHVGSRYEDGNGYDGVLIENCMSFWNDGDGIIVGGTDQNGGRNSVVRYCTAFSNPGKAGIWIMSAQNGLIEHCLAYNNACINIWTWNSINVTIRHCEAFRGRPTRDAGGFDIDWGCQGSMIEYCYAHHNEGPGFLIMGSGGEYRGFPRNSSYNILRYCVSENNRHGISSTGGLKHSKIYNNTIFASGGNLALEMGGHPPPPNREGDVGWPSDCEIRNNIFVGVDDATLLYIDDHASRQNNRFDYNLYWRPGSDTPLIRWGGRRHGPKFWQGSDEGTFPPEDYASVKAFAAATEQESHGVEADPLLRAHGSGEYGRLPLKSYQLRDNSPAIGAGAAIELSQEWLDGRSKYLTDTGAERFGIPMQPKNAEHDYWGNALDGSAAAVSIGAHEPRRRGTLSDADAERSR